MGSQGPAARAQVLGRWNLTLSSEEPLHVGGEPPPKLVEIETHVLRPVVDRLVTTISGLLGSTSRAPVIVPHTGRPADPRWPTRRDAITVDLAASGADLDLR